MPELIATIDVGTNTAHLLLAHITDAGEAIPMHSETRFVRLGQGIDATGDVHPAALSRLRQALLAFRDIAEAAGAAQVLVAGTSASRDARDPQHLVDFVREETGLEYEIVTGEEEAFLTALGAMSSIPWSQPRALIVDIGGGSTELTRVGRDAETLRVDSAVSLDLGSVRLTERFFKRLPPDRGEVTQIREFLMSVLGEVVEAVDADCLLVGAAGTIRALAMLNGGARSSVDLIRGEASVSSRDCTAWAERLVTMDEDSVRALDPQIMSGRADVFAAGVLILESVFEHTRADHCVVSPRGLRHGMAIRYASLKKARGG